MLRRAGFTLLEVLMAITLMLLVAGSLYSSLYISNHASRSAVESLQPARTAAITFELLRQDFDTVVPSGTTAGAFTGTDSAGATGTDSLSFFTLAHVAQENEVAGDMRKVDLSVDTVQGANLPALVRHVTTNLQASTDPLVYDQVICRNVKTFNLRYWDGTVWQDTWDSTAQNLLPLAVEVTLEFDPQPSAAPRANASTYKMIHVYRIACGQSAQNADSQAPAAPVGVSN